MANYLIFLAMMEIWLMEMDALQNVKFRQGISVKMEQKRHLVIVFIKEK